MELRAKQSQPHILIVDDDPALLQALPNMLNLRLNHVQVDTTDSASNALAQINSHDYDAIISDIRMPGMDGFELLHELQQRTPETPILLMTGHGDQSMAIRALRGGAYDYILKPIDRVEFVASVQRALDTTQLRRQVQQQRQALQTYANSLEQQVQARTQELVTKNAELVAANETKDQMLRMVVHELARPLTSIKGMFQLLQRQVKRAQPLEKIARGLQTIHPPLSRLERLIGDLHDALHISAHQFDVQLQTYDMLDLCTHVLNEFTHGTTPTPTISGHKQSITANIDPQRLSQVLVNLLTNARKYSPKDSPITVTLEQTTHHISISVQDQGIGIPPEALSHIYEQFYRVPGAEIDSESITGLGLGLYISDAIIKLHHGHIDVHSTPGQGSTFSIILPTPHTSLTTSIIWHLS